MTAFLQACLNVTGNKMITFANIIKAVLTENGCGKSTRREQLINAPKKIVANVTRVKQLHHTGFQVFNNGWSMCHEKLPPCTCLRLEPTCEMYTVCAWIVVIENRMYRS